MRDFLDLGVLDANLRQLEGHKCKAIVARGLLNACAILKMLDEYALGAKRHHVDRNLLELSNAGTLRVARFAHDMVSWHFGLKEVFVAALDMANKGRAACEGECVILARRLEQSLEYYLGTNLYNPTIDIRFVECSCVPSVVERLKSCFNTQTRSATNGDAGKQKKQRRTSEPRRFLALAVAARLSLAARTRRKIAGRSTDFSERSRPQHDNMDRYLMTNLRTS